MKAYASIGILVSVAVIAACGSDTASGIDLAPEQSELAQHYSALSTATDVPAATVEANRHQQAMMDRLNGLRTSINRMASNGGCMSGSTGLMNTMLDICNEMAVQVQQHKDLISACPTMDAVSAERDRYRAQMDGYMGSMHTSMMGTRCGTMMGGTGMGGMMGR